MSQTEKKWSDFEERPSKVFGYEVPVFTPSAIFHGSELASNKVRLGKMSAGPNFGRAAPTWSACNWPGRRLCLYRPKHPPYCAPGVGGRHWLKNRTPHTLPAFAPALWSWF